MSTRAHWLALLALQGCLVPVDETGPAARPPTDGGPSSDAGSRDGGRHDAGQLPVPLACESDAGADGWCVDQPGSTRRCAEAELFGCSLGTSHLVQRDGWLAWSSMNPGTQVTEVWARQTDGSAPILVATTRGVAALALEGGFVWWREFGSGEAIRRAPVTGGASQLIAATRAPIGELAIDVAHVYWNEGADGGRRLPRDGGAQEVFPGDGPISMLTLDSTHLYFATRDPLADVATIRRVPLAGGPSSAVFENQPPPSLLAVTDGFIYWSRRAARGDLWRGRVDGGPVDLMMNEPEYTTSFAVDARDLYQVSDGMNAGERPSRLVGAPLDGGRAQVLITPGHAGPIALDATWLYVSTPNIYRLRR